MILDDQKFKKLCKEVCDVQGHDTLFLSFSRGKDSLSSFLRCYETGVFKKYVLFHMSLLFGFSFVDEYLDYFRQKYPEIVLVDVPEPSMNRRRNSFVLQTPIGLVARSHIMAEIGAYTPYNWTLLEQFIKEDHDLPLDTLTAVGVKASDSPMRKLAISKTGAIGIKKKKWFPIYDYTDRDVGEIIKRHGVKLPKDYEYWSRTFDGFDYRFIKYIQTNLPKDYQLVKDEYPLIDLVISRREHYFGTKQKKTRFNYLNHDLNIF